MDRATPEVDFIVENHSSIFLLRPDTAAALQWVEENIGWENGYQPYWPTVVVEHRYIGDIITGIKNEGLEVR